ncbi:MAG: arsenate reductase (glutaredoxin) [Pseudomonadota bacterium]
MALSIYHNPRCSKSRKTLELIENNGENVTVIRYLENPPSAARLLEIAALLGVAVADLLRTGEATYKSATDLPSLDDDSALAAWLANHPIVLQRPIVVDDAKARAVVGRPPENVTMLLNP